MTGIFSDINVGAVIVRDPETGLPVSQPNTFGVLVPPPEYGIDCDMTALPEDCNVRPQNKQINAMVSEIINFAASLDPDGNWDCEDYNNLAVAFQNWVADFTSGEIGAQLCEVVVGDGTITGSDLIYCENGDVKKLPISGPDSLMDIVTDYLCGSDVIAPTNNADYILFCRNGVFYKFRANTWQNYVGPWVQARTYTVNNMVRVGNLLYAPNAAIPSGTAFAIGTTGATWFEVSPTVTPPYDEELGYPADTIISKDGKFYAANDDIPPDTVFVIGTTGQTWREVDFTQAFILDHVATKKYQKSSVVTFDGHLWRATAVVNPAAFAPGPNWQAIGGDRNVFMGPWTIGHNSTRHVPAATQYQYLQFQVVTNGGLIYMANGNIPLGTAFVVGTGPTQWTEQSPSVAPVYEPSIEYAPDSVIFYNGSYWAANDTIPAGTPFVVGTTGKTWRAVTMGSTNLILEAFSSVKAYPARSLILFGNAIWYTPSGHPAGPWNEANWRVVGERSVYRGPWSNTVSYSMGDVVAQMSGTEYTTGTLFRANGNIPTGTSFVIGSGLLEWTVINVSSTLRGYYDVNKTYRTTNLVAAPSGLYFANGTINPGTPFALGVTGATWRSTNNVRIPSDITSLAVLAVSDHADCFLQFTGAGAKTYTINANSGTFQTEIGSTISGTVSNGQLAIVAGAGVTIRRKGGLVLDAADWSSFTLTKIATNIWHLTGDFA